jgi:FtsP/CotA-like multicopper oxidase with cupredoxin domain
MQFRVVPAQSADASTPPSELVLPPREPLPSNGPTREVSLNEVDSQTVLVAAAGRSGVIRQACGSERAVPFGPVAALLGTVDEQDAGLPLTWMDSATERPTVGTVETWSIHNFTMDAHPIHLHLVMFEVIERVGADGQSRPPEPAESGLKDTVIAYPGEITRIRAHFDREGLYVWHCHIVEHEDNEMMRPLLIESAAATPSL